MSNLHLQVPDKILEIIDKQREKYGVGRTTYVMRLLMDHTDEVNLDEHTLAMDPDYYNNSEIVDSNISNGEELMKSIEKYGKEN